MKVDPIYGPISKRFHENPQEFADAFAKAWYKLTHRDMGPVSRYLGPEVPSEQQIWQDPLPAADHLPIDEHDVAALKSRILASGLTVSQLVTTAWASASTFRGTDKRGGANGARIRLARKRIGPSTTPRSWQKSCKRSNRFRPISTLHLSGGKKVSLADVIVLGGAAAIEQAAKNAGHDVKVSFSPGRTDAAQENTDTHHSRFWNRLTDGFRNYLGTVHARSPEQRLLDRAHLLTLTAPEMTVLVGGLRVLGANPAVRTRRLHNAARHADERLLREPARHVDEVAAERRRLHVRSARPAHRRAEMDRHELRFDLRLQLAAARRRRSLRHRRR